MLRNKALPKCSVLDSFAGATPGGADAYAGGDGNGILHRDDGGCRAAPAAGGGMNGGGEPSDNSEIIE